VKIGFSFFDMKKIEDMYFISLSTGLGIPLYSRGWEFHFIHGFENSTLLKNRNKKGSVLTVVELRIKGKMIRRKIVPLLFSIFIQFFFIGSVWAQGLVVVANPEAPNISPDYVKRIYLGFTKTLPDGTPALPLIMKGTPETFFRKVNVERKW
jgi:hypothetical protein